MVEFLKTFGGKIFLPNLDMGFRADWNGEMGKHEIGYGGGSDEYHSDFFQGLITLFKIAGLAGDHHIRPIGFSSPGFWVYMIHGEQVARMPTILAGVVIPLENIFFAE